MTQRFSILLLALLIPMASCENKKSGLRPKLYFKDLIPPAAVKATILEDNSFNKVTGGEIVVRVLVDKQVDRDQLDRTMKELHRQISNRDGFGPKKDLGVRRVDVRFYTSKTDAKAGGGNWIASVYQEGIKAEPTMENKQKAPLLKWVYKALGPMPQYTKEKPRILTDADKMTVEIKLPYVKDDGTGEPVEKMTFNRATRTWASLVLPLFDKIEKLTELTYIGTYKGDEVFKVTIDRPLAKELNLRKVEESLGAFQGTLITKRLSKEINDKQMATLTAKERTKVYKDVVKKIPKDKITYNKKTLK